ncbi:MAG TPA: VWA domain-containing protein [Vicinamibacterales bacterium]|jgi:VWFA-related protein
MGAITALALQAQQDQPRPTFRTEANYVRVDVYATTADGTPIGDLRREEFKLLEDRVPQTIDQFTTVAIRTGIVPATRSDPRTPEDSRQAAADSRARVFVLFLDAIHVDGNASKIIARPLTDALRQLLGPDDLIAVVSQQMTGRTITFTRQISVVEGALDRAWGTRDRVDITDPVEQRYAQCYPGLPRRRGEIVAADLGIAQEMILRRREEQTLDALEELVTYLRDAREERKAVITVTNGWRIYSPNQTLARPIEGAVPSTPTPGFDPRIGKLSTDATVTPDPGSACDADRMRLAYLDHRQRFRDLLDRANRANVSFYPVDPRGVVVFDDDIVPVAGVGQNPTISPIEDNRRLGERHTSLRTMAESTDGAAVIDTSNFAPALRRITNDLSSYYLLGYYSSGKLDGRFHGISVSVSRPGVQVRARRGYLAATTAPSATAPATPANAAALAEAEAVKAALAPLSAIAREPSVFVQAAISVGTANTSNVFTVIEIPRGAGTADWIKGGEADVLLIDPAGNSAGSGHATFAPGSGSARLTMTPRALTPGSYEIRVRAKGATATSAVSESVRLAIAASSDGSGAIFFRRGPTTGNKEVATADLRFRRSDTLRVNVPVGASGAPDQARLLDRAGKALAIPVSIAVSNDADGSRWLSAQATLAALAPGDYLIEVTANAGGAQKRTLTAFRVVP